MFRSRVQGVGSQRAFTKEELRNICENFPGTMYCSDTVRAAVCHPESPAGTCKPVDWKPDAVSTPPAPAPAKPSAALGALPLILGAVYLLMQ
jgi:hypothetical protein